MGVIQLSSVYIALLHITFCTAITSDHEDTNWKKEYLYFKKVELSCTSTKPDLVTQSVQFWILPSGEIRRPFENAVDSHLKLLDNGFVLSIDRLDDPDFGLYYCIVSTGRNATDVIKIGVNINGPYYGEELMERYKRNAVVGGIAAGVTLVLLAAIWILYKNITCTKQFQEGDVETPQSIVKPEHVNGSALQDSSVVQDQNKLDGWILTTKIGDNIYDSADSIKPDKKDDPVNSLSSTTTQHGDRLVSTDSGHYQTIGSLERDQKLLSESEINDDVRVLKHVIRRDWSETTEPEETSNNVTNSLDVDPDLHTELSDSVIYDHADSITMGISQLDGQEAGILEEVEYSVSSKAKRHRNESVVIIDGDVVLEPNGTSVTVTTVSNIQTVSSPTDNIVNTPISGVYENTSNKIAVQVAPLEKLENKQTISDVTDTNDKNEMLDNSEADIDNEQTATKGQRKASTTSTTKSEGESNPSTSVDEDTFSKYQNVLASLVTKHGNSSNGSSPRHEPGSSRSTSVDSNVFQEDEQGTSTGTRSIQDVRL